MVAEFINNFGIKYKFIAYFNLNNNNILLLESEIKKSDSSQIIIFKDSILIDFFFEKVLYI